MGEGQPLWFCPSPVFFVFNNMNTGSAEAFDIFGMKALLPDL